MHHDTPHGASDPKTGFDRPPEHHASTDLSTLRQLNADLRPSLHRYFARRVRGDPGEIEDMVQEVFLRLLKRSGVAELEHLRGYVFRTASSVLADHLRLRRSRLADAHDEFNCDSHGDVGTAPEEELIAHERVTQASELLLVLPERTRTVFVLRQLEGLRYKDVAARLGISVSAVEKHMQRAVAHLVENLDWK